MFEGSLSSPQAQDGALAETHSATYPPPAPKGRRIAILGFSDTVRDAPVNDPSWELWAMNGFHRAAKPDFGIDVPEERYGLWLDMHTLQYTREYGKRAGIGDSQIEWLQKEHPFPILMLDEDPSLPSVRRYPIEDVIRILGGRDYFTSTIAYALALALTLEGVTEIGVWGVDLVHDSEYADQRPCAEYYLGYAAARGVKLTIHEKSALLKQSHRYGYGNQNPMIEEMRGALQRRADVITKRIAQLKEENEKFVQEMQTQDGALQMVKNLFERLEIYERGGRL
jgi:hypothetical protein